MNDNNQWAYTVRLKTPLKRVSLMR